MGAKLRIIEAHALADWAAARNLIDGAPPQGVLRDELPPVAVHSPRASVELPAMPVENRASFVLRLPQATIAGSLGVIYEGFLLPGGVSHSMGWLDPHRREAGWCELPAAERVDVPESGLCMLGVLSHWGHFFVDVLDRLLLLRERRWLDRRLVTDTGASATNAVALAQKLGFAADETRLFRASHRREYHVKDFVLPTLESAKPAISARSFRELRDRVAPGGAPGAETLFVGRKDVHIRHIVGQDALVAHLERAGQARAVFPEFMTIDEAIARFSAARTVILPIGSAKFNLAFCRPGTRVVCVTPAGYAEQNAGVTGMVRHICHALGLPLAFYSCAIRRHPQILLHSDLLITPADTDRMLELIA